MRRREFLGLVGGTAAAWPLAARAQQPTLPMVGFLTSLGRNDRPNLVEAIRLGLSETGYVEGRNVTIEYRFAEYQYDQLPALGADLVGRKVAVIVATAGNNTILAAKASTTTIPIVFTTGGDAVQAGLVDSLNRPGGNATGISWFGYMLSSKALGLLRELVPDASIIAIMLNPKNRETETAQRDSQEAARALGRQLLVLNASTPGEIDAAFATLRQQRAGALLVASDPYFTGRRQQIVALAARDAIPAMYFNREFVAEGGLLSYGNDVPDAYRRAGIYVGRILKGEKPTDLPVEQATKFALVINLRTAKALGIQVPATLLGRADEIIE